VALAPAFAAAWLLAELARGRWFTGFPWGAGGYAHVDGPLAFLAPWVGVYGIGWVAALGAGWLALAVAPSAAPAPAPAPALRRGAGIALVGVVLALALVRALPLPEQPSSGRLKVSLLQGNIAQDEKFQPGTGVKTALSWYGEQLRVATGQLVVAPETALPLLPHELPGGYLQEIDEHFRGGQQALLVGLPLGDGRTGYTNSVLGLAPAAGAYRYDKHHLVPFGEFIPPLFRWFTEMMNIPLGDFRHGAVGQLSFEWKGQRLAPNICYEDLFGEELAARFVDPLRAPTIFVNLSNIAWFGDSIAIEQHLQISRMRALEFQRPMLRATNTGATAIIDAQGQVTHRLPRLTRGTLEGEVEGRSGLTPYARWAGAWGLAPLWIWGLLTLGALVLGDFLGRRVAAAPGAGGRSA
jgi:apolipoprotein N-acyltransferase